MEKREYYKYSDTMLEIELSSHVCFRSFNPALIIRNKFNACIMLNYCRLYAVYWN